MTPLSLSLSRSPSQSPVRFPRRKNPGFAGEHAHGSSLTSARAVVLERHNSTHPMRHTFAWYAGCTAARGLQLARSVPDAPEIPEDPNQPAEPEIPEPSP